MSAGPSRTASSGLLLGAALLVLVGLAGDVGLRALAWPAAAVLLAVGLRDLLAGPVLVADAAGVRVLSGVRRQSAPWSQVERLRIVTDRRTRLLEVDLGSSLAVLSRRRLGRSPDDVLADLQGLVSAGRQD